MRVICWFVGFADNKQGRCSMRFVNIALVFLMFACMFYSQLLNSPLHDEVIVIGTYLSLVLATFACMILSVARSWNEKPTRIFSWPELIISFSIMFCIFVANIGVTGYVSERIYEKEGIALCVQTETKVEHTSGGFLFFKLLADEELKCTRKNFEFHIDTALGIHVVGKFQVNDSRKAIWFPLLLTAKNTEVGELDQLGTVAIPQVTKCAELLVKQYSPEVASLQFNTWPGDYSFLPARTWPPNWVHLPDEVKQTCDISQFGFTWEGLRIEKH